MNQPRAMASSDAIMAFVARPITMGQSHRRGSPLAKPNYSFEKRQREIAKKKKQDEKDARKREAREAAQPASPASGDAPEPPASE